MLRWQFRSTSCLAETAAITLDGGTLQVTAGLRLSVPIVLQPGRRHDRHQRLPRDARFCACRGSGALTVIDSSGGGNGTLVLGADNDSTGGVDIESATVQLAGADALGSGNLTVNGTLDLAGYSVQVASLAGADVTIIDSSGGGTLQLESDSTLGDLA